MRGVGIDKANSRLFWAGSLGSCFLLPQCVVAIHEVRLGAGAFPLLVKFLGTELLWQIWFGESSSTP